jgi:hypothetical protein
MSKFIAVIRCKTCNKELTRIEANDSEVTEPDIFVPQMDTMLEEFGLPNTYCQDCRNKR